MKKLFALFALFIFQKNYAQNVELQGTVQYYDLQKTGKIYYAEAGKKFNTKDFIEYDENKKYKFSISIEKIKNEKINNLVFGIDTTQRTNDEHACIQKINVGEIINDTLFKKMKSIKLRNDFLLDRNCTSSVYYGAEKEETLFIGNYQLVSKDTARSIMVKDFFYVYNSALSKFTVNYTNEEFGHWNYNKEKKLLSFNKLYDLNSKFGILVKNNYRNSFKVVEKNGDLIFKNKTVLLKKLQ